MSAKKESYASITRKINALLDRQEQEKKRMSAVMSDALLTDRIATRIGDFSDADLRKVMRLLSGHLDACIAKVENDRKTDIRSAGNAGIEHPVNVQNSSSGYHQIQNTAVVQ